MGDYPEGPPSQFKIQIEKEAKAAVGLDVDDSDGRYIYVVGVKAGPFKTYNEGADANNQLRPGDFLVQVNDKQGNAEEMLEELKSNEKLDIVAKHPMEVTVAIKKTEKKAGHGLELRKKVIGTALLIMGVNDGPFKEWNATNEDHQVCELDRIVSVAGFQGKATDLVRKLNNNQYFQAIVVRPANQDHWSNC